MVEKRDDRPAGSPRNWRDEATRQLRLRFHAGIGVERNGRRGKREEEFPFFSLPPASKGEMFSRASSILSSARTGISIRERGTRCLYLYTLICRVARPSLGNSRRGRRTAWTIRGAATLPSTRSPGTRSSRPPG